ncbi:MAG: E3 ubiquitin ligase family protein [Roseiflexaceae bacterium]
MFIVGILLLIAAAVCFFIARSQSGKLQAMNATDTYSAQLLHDLHAQVTSSLGADALAQPCEVEGVIECDAPLTTSLSRTVCVAYTRTVTREYEEDITETDSQGKTQTRTQRGSETVESEERHTNFWVRDATGRTQVDPEGADLDLVETSNHYDPAASPGRGRARTLGQRSVEQALPIGTRVYVLGCAVDQQGQPTIARSPRDPKARFIISRKSERELAQSAASWSRNLYYAAVGSGVVGLVLLVIGLVR